MDRAASLKIALILALVLSAPFMLARAAFAYTSPGKPVGFVNDFAHVLKADQVQTLEGVLSAFEKSAGAEIAVVTIPTLGGDTVENYAVELFEEWGIGKKGQDNGALLLVAIEDRKMRIEVGYGLEPLLTDAESSHIINAILKPAFQKEDYYAGISAAVDRMQKVIGGEAAPTEKSESGGWNFDVIANLFFFGFIFLIYLGSVLARSKSWWGGGVVGGVVGILVGIFLGFVYIGIVALVLFVPLGLLLDFFISKTYKQNVSAGRRHPWWIGGGGFGSGSGSGGGGGGFGGFGGGGSGGGGSSGGW